MGSSPGGQLCGAAGGDLPEAPPERARMQDSLCSAASALRVLSTNVYQPTTRSIINSVGTKSCSHKRLPVADKRLPLHHPLPTYTLHRNHEYNSLLMEHASRDAISVGQLV
jgi:hypothetical protein